MTELRTDFRRLWLSIQRLSALLRCPTRREACPYSRPVTGAALWHYAYGAAELAHWGTAKSPNPDQGIRGRCRAAVAHNSATQTWPTETRLRGWACRTRTQESVPEP